MIERKSLRKNKKGNINVLLMFFVILFSVLLLGFVMVMFSSVFNIVWDEAYPIVSQLGVVESANLTEYSSYTFAPVNTVIQSFTWLTGIIYVMMLVVSFGFVMMTKANPSRWLIGLYFGLALLLIICSMYMSNIYEDFYDDSGELGDRLKEHKILSWMILYSPMVFTFLVFATGIVLFSGMQQEEFI